VRFDQKHLHPSVVAVGMQMAAGTLNTSDSRCVAMLHALKDVRSARVLCCGVVCGSLSEAVSLVGG
jgi:hypothetical protein